MIISKTILNKVMKPETVDTAEHILPLVGTPLFGIVFPDGRRIDGLTKQEAIDTLPWMPAASKIVPPLPPGNVAALRLLDFLCK